MRKAFDTILHSEVTAELAKQSGGLEKYRYECIRCGEEVYVAAPFSTKVVVHFKHRNGNNDVECENYLGQFGILRNDSSSRKSNRERVEFFFDSENKVFSIGLKFSENEIKVFEEQGVNFELRVNDSDTPCKTIKINALNFTPEIPSMVPLNTFSFSYYLSNTGNGAKRKYDLFNRNTPTFFKMLGNEDTYSAKMVRSTVVYTDTRYFVAFPSQAVYYTAFDGIEIIDTFSFKTMERNFKGIVLKVLKKTPQVDRLIITWGYQLEASEMLTLLWPPASMNGEVTEIASNSAYLYTSFTLQAHGNINLHAEDIVPLATGVTKVSVSERTKVFRKNAEIVIENKKRLSLPYELINVAQETSNGFTVPNDSTYFIFNNSGITPLTSGQKLSLTHRSVIRHFHFGYLEKEILPLKCQELSGKELLTDILKYIKITEKHDAKCFALLPLSVIALEYISECNATGLINSAVKQYILEGKL